MILDAIFGIGLSRNVEGAYRKLIRWINGQEDMKVIAVDVPSGISSDNGSVMGDAVRADMTVTFGEKKLGQVLFPGRELCGHLLVKDVGFVPESSAEREKHVQMLDREDLLRIPARMADSNKGTYGKVLVMAGAKNMAGASLLSARAAYRMGAGLVKVFTPEENRLIVQEKLPEAILATYDTKEAEKDPENFARKIARETEWADVIVLGPGIGMEDYARCMVENVLKDAYVPIILDADALNLAAEYRELTGYFTENIIVTPHMKEMSRLTGIQIEEMKENPVRTAREFADQYWRSMRLKGRSDGDRRKRW
ncbi:MAG: NAD(P)H-hydrate dehydratase [Pilosibacter sp.]